MTSEDVVALKEPSLHLPNVVIVRVDAADESGEDYGDDVDRSDDINVRCATLR